MVAPSSTKTLLMGFVFRFALAQGCTSGGGKVGLPATPTPAVRPLPTRAPGVASTAACRVLVEATPTPHRAGYLLEDDHRYGPLDAAVTLVVYGDYQCEPCARLDAALWDLLAAYPDGVLLVYRHFPLVPVHDKALMAVQAVEAAARQDRFWEYHRRLYAEQSRWKDLPPEAFPAYLVGLAEELGLERARFMQDLSSEAIQALALRAWNAGRALGLQAVPVVFVNGEWFPGPVTPERLAPVVRLSMLARRAFSTCPDWRIDPNRTYLWEWVLPQGPVTVELIPSWAPQGVNAVVFLAQEGWYRGMGVYAVEPGRAVYLGDPSNTGYGHPGFLVPWEPPPQALQAGHVALQPETPGWNSPRLAVLLGPRPDWESRVTVVGRVLKGLSLLQALAPPEPGRFIPVVLLDLHQR